MEYRELVPDRPGSKSGYSLPKLTEILRPARRSVKSVVGPLHIIGPLRTEAPIMASIPSEPM